MNCMLVRKRFEDDMAELKPDLVSLRKAAIEIQSSDRFKRLLQVSSSGRLKFLFLDKLILIACRLSWLWEML